MSRAASHIPAAARGAQTSAAALTVRKEVITTQDCKLQKAQRCGLCSARDTPSHHITRCQAKDVHVVDDAIYSVEDPAPASHYADTSHHAQASEHADDSSDDEDWDQVSDESDFEHVTVPPVPAMLPPPVPDRGPQTRVQPQPPSSPLKGAIASSMSPLRKPIATHTVNAVATRQLPSIPVSDLPKIASPAPEDDVLYEVCAEMINRSQCHIANCR